MKKGHKCRSSSKAWFIKNDVGCLLVLLCECTVERGQSGILLDWRNNVRLTVVKCITNLHKELTKNVGSLVLPDFP